MIDRRLFSKKSFLDSVLDHALALAITLVLLCLALSYFDVLVP
jgi:hypothetical protein